MNMITYRQDEATILTVIGLNRDTTRLLDISCQDNLLFVFSLTFIGKEMSLTFGTDEWAALNNFGNAEIANTGEDPPVIVRYNYRRYPEAVESVTWKLREL
jgi:hypothetical protein